MKLLLQNGLNPVRSDALYDDLADRLAAAGLAVTRCRNEALGPFRVESHDFFVSNIILGDEIRRQTTVYGGYRLSRPELLRMSARCGLPVMPWIACGEVPDPCALFDRWGVERLLAKRSQTFGGKGVTAFTRGGLDAVGPLDPEDIYCPELHPERGDLFKAEVYGGALLIGWRSRSTALRNVMRGAVMHGIAKPNGDRELFTFKPALRTRIECAAGHLERLGFGLCSLDFMEKPDGGLALIEINVDLVAAWWTQQFDFFRAGYADGILGQARRLRKRPRWLRKARLNTHTRVRRWIHGRTRGFRR